MIEDKLIIEKSRQRKTKLPWFIRLLRHLARKWDGLILQGSRAHTGQKQPWVMLTGWLTEV